MQYTQLSRRSAGGSKIDWEKQYLTFIPVEDAVFSWAERATSGHLEYSVNGGQTWVTIADGDSTPTIMAGSKVVWRGDLMPHIGTGEETAGIGCFSSTGNYKAYGNIMSLLFYDNYYKSQLNNSLRCAFFLLFRRNGIITPPLFPATELSNYCYYGTFEYCQFLSEAPTLPALVLASNCYRKMFMGTAITAITLPATTPQSYSYRAMLQSCSNLVYIKCLLTSLGDNVTYIWTRYVGASGTFVKAAGMEDWAAGPSGIPSGWTVVDDNS